MSNMNRAIIALTAIAMVVGCAKDETTESWASDSVAHFSTESAMTRVVSSDTASTWVGGDLIGISSTEGDSNVKYEASVVTENNVTTTTFSAATGVDPILLPRNKDVTYSAYYPWKSGTKYTSNVATQSDLGAIDLLVSNSVVAKEDGNTNVQFTFGHKLSMVKFKIVLADELKALYPDYATNFATYLNKLTIEDAVTEATYSFTGVYDSTVATTIGDITVPVSVDGDYSDSNPATALVILNPIGESVTMKLVLLFDTRMYEYSFTLNATQGAIHEYEVTIGYKSIKVLLVDSINEWTLDNATAEQLGSTTEIKQGTAGQPFEVSSVTDLEMIGCGQTYNGSIEPWDPSAHYKLTADITCTYLTEITPAISESNPFFGELDGGGYTITNVKVATTGDSNTGLIPYISANAKIHDLNLVDCNISATSGYVGAIAGHNEGTIKNCTVTGTSVTNTASTSTGCGTGGIVGHNEGIVDGCVNSAEVIGDWKVGGIVGYLNEGIVMNCGNTGYVTNNLDSDSNTGQQGTGGIAGSVDSKTYILNCYNKGSITTNGYQSGGGIAGYTNQGIIRSCYNVGYIMERGSNENAGGVVGRTHSASNVVDCYYSGNCLSDDVGIGAISNGTTDSTESMTEDAMREADFVDTLNAAAKDAQAAYTSVTFCEWISVSAGFPVIDTANPVEYE